MKSTYWNHTGKFNQEAEELRKLIPGSGSVDNPRRNRALERFRKASNCYYDLYNNGLGNRSIEFRSVFKIASSNYKVRGARSYGQYSSQLYDMTELAMDDIIVAAIKEQGIEIVVDK